MPDFVNEGRKEVYEYFGTYWHPDPDEERRIKEFYAQRGWTCYVLWESDLFAWLSNHAHLVTDEGTRFRVAGSPHQQRLPHAGLAQSGISTC